MPRRSTALRRRSIATDKAGGYSESLYRLTLPEEPGPEDKVSEQAWLSFLDRISKKYGTRPPDGLHLLRRHGALTKAELEKGKQSQ